MARLLKYWIFRYDPTQRGYVPAGGSWTNREDQALRWTANREDMAIYRYDHSGNVPSLIPSLKLANASFLDDLENDRLDGDGKRVGRPIEREGAYRRITLEIRDDLLAKIDASGKSRREYIETLVENS